MAQQQPNLSANTPQNFIPLQPATPSTAQDIEQAGLMEYRLRSASDLLGNVTDVELGVWDEYHHELLVARSNVTGVQAASTWFTQAFAQGGVANVAIIQAINNACVLSITL